MTDDSVAPAAGGLILEIVSAPPLVGARRLVLPPGRTARVGRTERADLVVAQDERMSGPHFSIAWDGAACTIRDLRSAGGTLLNGEPVEAGEAAHGDWIRAGGTDFVVYREGFTQRGARPASPARDAILGLLDGGGPLFAILDAARSRRILELLRESVDEHQSLYEGVEGEAYARVAPYLVKLSRAGSPLLGSLVAEGWSRSWGVFLTSARPFRDVRKHLRRFLVVDDPAGKKMVFRFYDPRVLRRFVPLSTPRQLDELFEGVSRFVVEGKGGGEAHVLEARPGEPLDHRVVDLREGSAA